MRRRGAVLMPSPSAHGRPREMSGFGFLGKYVLNGSHPLPSRREVGHGTNETRGPRRKGGLAPVHQTASLPELHLDGCILLAPSMRLKKITFVPSFLVLVEISGIILQAVLETGSRRRQGTKCALRPEKNFSFAYPHQTSPFGGSPGLRRLARFGTVTVARPFHDCALCFSLKKNVWRFPRLNLRCSGEAFLDTVKYACYF